MPPRIGSLCSGYGGLDMAVQAAVPGAEVAWHAQYDPDDRHQYAARILEHRFPGVPNHGDVTAETWFGVEPVDILTAGYPCQPISWAGQGRTTEDARWLWPHVARAVRLLRPRLVLLENVAAHVVRGLADVVADLAEVGYVGSWICVRASDVGAPHQRERLFVLAHPADADPCGPGLEVRQVEPARHERQAAERGDRGTRFDFGPYAAAVARWGRVTGRPAPDPVDARGHLAPRFSEWMMGLPAGWVTDVPGIPRNAQLKALGNGVVPQQGAAAFRILYERLAGRMPERSAA